GVARLLDDQRAAAVELELGDQVAVLLSHLDSRRRRAAEPVAEPTDDRLHVGGGERARLHDPACGTRSLAVARTGPGERVSGPRADLRHVGVGAAARPHDLACGARPLAVARPAPREQLCSPRVAAQLPKASRRAAIVAASASPLTASPLAA